MKILLVTNMGSSEAIPHSGSYVRNQLNRIKEFKNQNDSIELFGMKRAITKKFGSILKYFQAFINFIPYYFKSYDIIHVHYFVPIYVLAYLYKFFHPKSKIVVTFHGHDATTDLEGSRIKIFRYLGKKIDYLIAVDEEIIPDIERKLNRKVDIQLCAGIDRRIFYPLENVNKEYDFIFVGAFKYHKGVDILIDAIKKYGDKKVKYCFVGTGPYRDEIQKLTNEYNVTLFPSQNQEQLRELYNKSKFFLFPMRQEGIGLVVREALYCGTPVIVPAHPGMKKVVIEGQNGFFFDKLDCDEVCKKIDMALKLSNEEYSKMSQNAKNLSDVHSLDYVCKKLIEIYNNLTL